MDKTVRKTADKIRNLEIQGATNVAVAVLKAFSEYSKKISGDLDEVKINLEQTAHFLANARPTEPMARNGVKYVLKEVREAISIPEIKETAEHRTSKFLEILEESKARIVKHGVRLLGSTQIIMSHCHSSTVESILVAVHKSIGGLSVIVTETRPLFQGRITATNLVKAGLDVTMIVDNASAMFLADDSFLPIDAVVIGCDEFTAEGDAINKVGSFAISLAARYLKKPLYIATPLLKAGTETVLSKPVIEKRPQQEIWKDAPEGLDIINPAFELVPANLISGYITEEGVIRPEHVFETAKKVYSWLK